MLVPKIRTVVHSQIGSAPFELFFKKPYLLIIVRVANRIDLSNFYTEKNMFPYELGTANYTNFQYDKSQFSEIGSRTFSETSLITDSFSANTKIDYVITYLEFDN